MEQWARPVASKPNPARDDELGRRAWEVPEDEYFKGNLVSARSAVRFISIVSLALAAGLLLGLVLFLRGL